MSEVKVDLIMWTYNSEKILPRVLQRIKEVIPHQNISRKIITDDHSTDNTVIIAKKFGWEVYPNKGKGVNDNTATAINLVTAPIFCSFEHDIIISKDWWIKLYPQILTEENVVVQGVRESTNTSFKKIDAYYNNRNDMPHESLDNNIAKTKYIQMFGYNERATPSQLRKLNLKWIVDSNVISEHIRKNFWSNIKHDYKMQKNLCSSTKFKILCLRMWLTSPIRALQLTLKTNYPPIFIIYPIDRFAIFIATIKIKNG
jgi:glycosyltransferase involved in cell wall biosynthesis